VSVEKGNNFNSFIVIITIITVWTHYLLQQVKLLYTSEETKKLNSAP
jgi:hypothetical protein